MSAEIHWKVKTNWSKQLWSPVSLCWSACSNKPAPKTFLHVTTYVWVISTLISRINGKRKNKLTEGILIWPFYDQSFINFFMCEHYDYCVCIHASADRSTRRAQQEDLNKRNWIRGTEEKLNKVLVTQESTRQPKWKTWKASSNSTFMSCNFW